MRDHQHKARNDLSCFPYADERPVDPRRAHFLLRGRHRGHAAPPRDRARVGGEGGRLRHRRRQRGGHLPPPPDPVGLGRGSRQFRSLGDHQVIYIINRITESEVATKTENFQSTGSRETGAIHSNGGGRPAGHRVHRHFPRLCRRLGHQRQPARVRPGKESEVRGHVQLQMTSA